MKILIVLASFLAISTAQASYFHVKCSNATGTLKWESGHNSNSMDIEYYDNNGSQTLNVKLNEIEISKGTSITLRDEKVSDCAVSSISSRTKVTAGRVTITPSQDSPNSLDKIHGKKIEAEVICEDHLNGMMYCPNN